MRLTKEVQYGILLTLYLARSGTANLRTVSKNLGTSYTKLSRVAFLLFVGGVLVSTGKDEYSLLPGADPTVLEVLQAIKPVLAPSKSKIRASIANVETRSLHNYVDGVNEMTLKLLNRTVRNIGRELVANELSFLNKTGLSKATN